MYWLFYEHSNYDIVPMKASVITSNCTYLREAAIGVVTLQFSLQGKTYSEVANYRTTKIGGCPYYEGDFIEAYALYYKGEYLEISVEEKFSKLRPFYARMNAGGLLSLVFFGLLWFIPCK